MRVKVQNICTVELLAVKTLLPLMEPALPDKRILSPVNMPHVYLHFNMQVNIKKNIHTQWQKTVCLCDCGRVVKCVQAGWRWKCDDSVRWSKRCGKKKNMANAASFSRFRMWDCDAEWKTEASMEENVELLFERDHDGKNQEWEAQSHRHRVIDR